MRKTTNILLATMAASGLTALALLAGPTRAFAAEVAASDAAQSTAHAMTLLVIFWCLASLRLSRDGGTWRIGMDFVPLRLPRADAQLATDR